MSKLKKIGYELKDVAIVQAPVSYTNHRCDVNPYVTICGREVYPIFVSPMASVTDQNNYRVWIDNKLTPLVPRSVQKSENNPNGLTFEQRMEIAKETFVSISLKEAQIDLLKYLAGLYYDEEIGEELYDFHRKFADGSKYYICIDIAHGTLTELYAVCRKIKNEYGDNVEIMTGNVANPAAYSFYADAGIDWCRLSIGTGSRCTSSANVGVHYPSATLVDDINEQRKAYAHSHNGNAPTKLILDGGVGWFDDIQKALCLGVDAVMCGKIFAECDEACERIYYARSLEAAYKKDNRFYLANEEDEPSFLKDGYKKFRDYYGMSSKRAQKQISDDKTKLKTSEGIDRPVEVKYPVAKWVDNMQSYLRSCMTYTNSHTIKEMQENAQVIILGGSGDLAYRK